MIDLVQLKNEDELKNIATEMKISACGPGRKRLAKDEKYATSKKEATAYKTEEYREFIKQNPCIQPILLWNRPIIAVNLVLTVEIVENDKEQWHLSMSRIVPGENEPQRVPSWASDLITQCFFDECQEIPTPSVVYPAIRDFIANKRVPQCQK